MVPEWSLNVPLKVAEVLVRMAEDRRSSDGTYEALREQCFSKLVAGFAAEDNPQVLRLSLSKCKRRCPQLCDRQKASVDLSLQAR
jgi:hypothetical protein